MLKKHDPKKREKKGVTMSQKKEIGMIRERKAITSRSKPYPSIHPSTHTLAPFDRDCMTLVRYSSCFLDHKHVHVPSIFYIPTLGIGITIHPFHIVNSPCLGDLSRTSLKKIKSDFGCPKKRNRDDSREKSHCLKE